MEDVFVTNIHVKTADNSTGFDIPLSLSERKHLVLTRFNGFKETHFLESLRDNMLSLQQESDSTKEKYPKNSNSFGLSYSNDNSSLTSIPVFYFPASRSKVLKPKRTSDSSLENLNLLDYMLKISDDNNSCPENPAEKIDLYHQCICGLQGFLQELYEEPKLELKEDLANFNFSIHLPDKTPFAIHQASDGFASLTNIYMAIALRSVLINGTLNHALPAIALVDELEAHLHFTLQRRVFPLLVSVFPNVQFMVTTNSPYIITALENAVVFDIGKKKTLENAFFYSYDSIVESYFCTNKQHQALLKNFACFKELANRNNISRAQQNEYIQSLRALNRMTAANFEIFDEYKKIIT
ncbi:MAG: ATP-binding protein [Clostridiales bacterium]|nr:ATP-binding protein [Clostridiales bacterium]